MSNTLEDQIKLERQYKEYAKELFIQRHEAEQEKGRGAHTRVGKGLLNYVSESLAKAIDEWLTEELKPRRGVKPKYKDLLQALETAVGHEDLVLNACAFTFESIINSVSSGDKQMYSISGLAGAIGKALYYECKLSAFLEQLKSYYQKGVVTEELKKRNLLRYKWNYIKEVTDSEGFQFYNETQEELKSLGVALIDIFITTTGLVEYTQEASKSLSITPTKTLVEIWKQNLNNISTRANIITPTIIKPTP